MKYRYFDESDFSSLGNPEAVQAFRRNRLRIVVRSDGVWWFEEVNIPHSIVDKLMQSIAEQRPELRYLRHNPP